MLNTDKSQLLNYLIYIEKVESKQIINHIFYLLMSKSKKNVKMALKWPNISQSGHFAIFLTVFDIIIDINKVLVMNTRNEWQIFWNFLII